MISSNKKKYVTALMGVLLFSFSPLFSMSVFAAADTCTWTGGGDASSWSDAANWSVCDNGNVPENGDDLYFPTANAGTINLNNDLGITSLTSINVEDGYTITFDATGADFSLAFTIVGNSSVDFEGEIIQISSSTTVDSGGLIDFGGTALNIGGLVAVSGGGGISFNTVGTVSFINNTQVNLSGTGSTLTVSSSTTLHMNGWDLGIDTPLGTAVNIFGRLTGATTFAKTGANSVLLQNNANNDDYTGVTTISGGTISANRDNSLGAFGVGNETIVQLGGILVVGGASTQETFILEPGSTLRTAFVSPSIVNQMTTNPNITYEFFNGGGLTYNFPLVVDGGAMDFSDGDTVSVDSITLNNSVAFSYDNSTAVEGNTYTVIETTNGATGTFAGLPEGAEYTDGVERYTISYVGGDGNDIVLTALPDDPVLSNLDVTPTVISEGDEITIAGTIEDPQGDALFLIVDWGDGSEIEVFNYPATVGPFGFAETHIMLDDNPTGTLSDSVSIEFSLTDAQLGTVADAQTFDVTVNNVAPIVSNPVFNNGSSVTGIGDTVDFTFDFIDEGVDDTFELNVDWGDGTVETLAIAAGSTSYTATHSYQQSGNYTFTATLADDDGGNALIIVGGSSVPFSMEVDIEVEGGAVMSGGAKGVGLADTGVQVQTGIGFVLIIVSLAILVLVNSNLRSMEVLMFIRGSVVNMRRGLSNIAIVMVGFVLMMFLPSALVHAAADTCTWTGGGDASSWSDAANWSGCDNGNVPEDGDTLYFPTANAGVTNLNNDLGITSLVGLTIEDNYTVSFDVTGTDFSLTSIDVGDSFVEMGSEISQISGSTIVSSNATLIFEGPMNLGGVLTVNDTGHILFNTGGTVTLINDVTVNVTASGGSFTIGGTKTFDFAGWNFTIDTVPGGVVQLYGTLTGDTTFIKDGTGNINIWSNNNDYTGTTTITDGGLFVFADNGLGASGAGNETFVNIGGELVLGGINTNESITLGFGSIIQFNDGIGAISNISNPMGTAISVDYRIWYAGFTYNHPLVVDGGSMDFSNPQLVTVDSLTLQNNVAFSLDISSPVPGSYYTLVETVNGVTGTFNGLSEGTVFNAGGQDYQISYVGGDGNDIVVRALLDNPAITNLNVTPNPVNEGQTVTASGTLEDPEGDALELTIDWGDGVIDVFNYPATVGSFTFNETHTFQDDNPTGTSSDIMGVEFTLTDNQTGTVPANDLYNITVNNVAPVVSGPVFNNGDNVIDAGETVDFIFDLADAGVDDTFELNVDWGDGTVETLAIGAGANGYIAMHTYQQSGNYSFSATLTDDDGGAAEVPGGGVFSVSLDIVVEEVVVVGGGEELADTGVQVQTGIGFLVVMIAMVGIFLVNGKLFDVR